MKKSTIGDGMRRLLAPFGSRPESSGNGNRAADATKRETPMGITSVRVPLDFVESEIERRLVGKDGRKVVLIDQDFASRHKDIEIIDVRTASLDALSRQPPDHVLYAADQDDVGLPFIMWLVERRIKFYPAYTAAAARYVHTDRHARNAIESEYVFQTAAGFAKFDLDESWPGYGDFENICQALRRTKSLPGAFVEVGCLQGSSGCAALKYMQEAGIFRPSYFLDVFDGFTYETALSSPDAVWAHMCIVEEGPDGVAARLKRFEQAALGRPVHVIKNNIITDELPAEIGEIAVANLDVDQLEAIYAGLNKLAQRIVVGGVLIVEDPGHTPQLIGAVAALEIFLATAPAQDFLPIYMRSGQYFLVRVRQTQPPFAAASR